MARRWNRVPVVHRNGLRYSNEAGRRKKAEKTEQYHSAIIIAVTWICSGALGYIYH